MRGVCSLTSLSRVPPRSPPRCCSWGAGWKVASARRARGFLCVRRPSPTAGWETRVLVLRAAGLLSCGELASPLASGLCHLPVTIPALPPQAAILKSAELVGRGGGRPTPSRLVTSCGEFLKSRFPATAFTVNETSHVSGGGTLERRPFLVKLLFSNKPCGRFLFFRYG